MSQPPASKSWILGTRASPLALVQAEMVRERLLAAWPGLGPESIQLLPLTTSGDRITDRPLADAGGKGLFTKELEEHLLSGRIDFAVHSMKDVETFLPDGLVVDCFLPREDPRDALICRDASRTLLTLPSGSRIGTSSLRRKAQILALRPDLTVVPFRGNVETRLKKLANGDADATLLALAGLKRLSRAAAATEILSTDTLLPAVGQGVIGVEARAHDQAVAALLAPLNDEKTRLALIAERAMLARLDGSCRTPIAGLAHFRGDVLHLHGFVGAEDGGRKFYADASASAQKPEALGVEVAEMLIAEGASECLRDH